MLGQDVVSERTHSSVPVAHITNFVFLFIFLIKVVGAEFYFSNQRSSFLLRPVFSLSNLPWLRSGSWCCKLVTTSQNEKSRFFTCPAITFIYRVEAAAWPISFRITNFLWVCEIWGNFVKKKIFCKLIKVQIIKSFCTYVTHIIKIVYHTPHFVSTQSIFSYKMQIPFHFFLVFTTKAPTFTQR